MQIIHDKSERGRVCYSVRSELPVQVKAPWLPDFRPLAREIGDEPGQFILAVTHDNDDLAVLNVIPAEGQDAQERPFKEGTYKLILKTAIEEKTFTLIYKGRNLLQIK
jgi:hypothetical protein